MNYRFLFFLLLLPVSLCAQTLHVKPTQKTNVRKNVFRTVNEALRQAEKISQEKKIPLISSMGTGNKLHPELLEISDIFKTSVCPLARAMRNLCKKNGIKKLKVVYSKEEPKAFEKVMENNKQVPASSAFVPATAGIIIASAVVNDLIR